MKVIEIEWKLAPHSQPTRCKIKTNLDFITPVFPYFRHFACSHLNILLASCDIYPSSD